MSLRTADVPSIFLFSYFTVLSFTFHHWPFLNPPPPFHVWHLDFYIIPLVFVISALTLHSFPSTAWVGSLPDNDQILAIKRSAPDEAWAR